MRIKACLAMAAVLPIACSDSGGGSGGAGPWDYEGVKELEPDPQKAGDPEAGYFELVHTGYIGCGVPYSLFDIAGAALPFTQDIQLPGRVGDEAEMPYGWNEHTYSNGLKVAQQNCLQCHAGMFNGELVVGLGSADQDFTSDIGFLADGSEALIKQFIKDPLEEAEIRKFINRASILGPETVMKTVGTNPAEMVAVTLASHRDPVTLAWSDEQLMDIPHATVPSDPPAWWRMSKKNTVFYTGMGRGDHRGTMMFASSLCVDDTATAAWIDGFFNDVNAYISTLEAPQWPFDIDEALAAKGEPVFLETCSGCHGTYSRTNPEAEFYPNLWIPLEVVRTDPLVALGGTTKEFGSDLVEWFNSSFYGDVAQLRPEAGYVPPPLDAVWMTAPYLHNGSIPTLEALLDSTKRPTYWKRVDHDSTNYDRDALGWPFYSLDYGQADALPEERKHIYDTTLQAHSNMGHTWGDELSPEDRRALLEYLKTL